MINPRRTPSSWDTYAASAIRARYHAAPSFLANMPRSHVCPRRRTSVTGGGARRPHSSAIHIYYQRSVVQVSREVSSGINDTPMNAHEKMR